MKKIFITTLMLLGVSFGVANAQNSFHINITEIQEYQALQFCVNEYDTWIFEKDASCDNQAVWYWYVGPQQGHSNNELVFTRDQISQLYDEYGGGMLNIMIGYDAPGCVIEIRSFYLHFHKFENVPEPWTQDYVWKRAGGTVTLSAPYVDNVACLWSTGSHNMSITVSQPGTYWLRLYNDCGEISDTIQVRDNVEVYRATTELTSNLNQVTWRVSDAQAQYISEVKVYRNNQHVGTAPYTDGVFTDDIGSENTQWQYHIVAVSKEGQNCPYKSYWKRTIHLDHVQGSQGNQILQWTPYEQENTPNPLTAYNVYDVVDGEPRLVMQVGNFTNVYSYNPADFEGYGTVAAVFGNKGIEDMAFSNMTTELLDVGEAMQKDLTIYPNPANGTFTVEGAKTLTVFNTLGQAVATSHSEDRIHSFTLRSGIYFVKSDEGTARKIVVE